MTAIELIKCGVTVKHFKMLKNMRQAHTREVTVEQLDLKGMGKSLRQLREDSDIGLREMARLLDLSASFLSDCELGERRLGPSHSLLFLKHCNV